MISKDLGPGVIMLCHMHLDCYAYLGIKFMYNGSWDAHLKDITVTGKRKVNNLLRVLCNPCLNLYVRRQDHWNTILKFGNAMLPKRKLYRVYTTRCT